MSGDIPDTVKRFIFDCIDSVELLDVLLLMFSHPNKPWNAETLSRELRTNIKSIETRLSYLKSIGLIARSAEGVEHEYVYTPHTKDLASVIEQLFNVNSIKRHQVLQLIFSPLKQARTLADGFRVCPKTKINGDYNG